MWYTPVIKPGNGTSIIYRWSSQLGHVWLSVRTPNPLVNHGFVLVLVAIRQSYVGIFAIVGMVFCGTNANGDRSCWLQIKHLEIIWRAKNETQKTQLCFFPQFPLHPLLLESVSAWPISKYKAISPNVDIKRANLSSNSPSVKPTQRNARMFPQRVRLWCGGGLCVGLLLNRQHKNLRFMASAQLEFADVYRWATEWNIPNCALWYTNSVGN